MELAPGIPTAGLMHNSVSILGHAINLFARLGRVRCPGYVKVSDIMIV